jgi:hypothetical protein
LIQVTTRGVSSGDGAGIIIIISSSSSSSNSSSSSTRDTEKLTGAGMPRKFLRFYLFGTRTFLLVQ